MRGVGAVGDVDGVDAAPLLLRDALEDPLRARTFDANGDPRIFGFEHLAQAFGDVELQRRVVGQLAFLARRLDQGRRDCAWRRCRGPQRVREKQARG